MSKFYPRKSTNPVDKKLPVPKAQTKKVYPRKGEVYTTPAAPKGEGKFVPVNNKSGWMPRKTYEQAITHPANPLYKGKK